MQQKEFPNLLCGVCIYIYIYMAGSINRRTLVLCIAARSRADPVLVEGRYPLKLSDTPHTKIVEKVQNLTNA